MKLASWFKRPPVGTAWLCGMTLFVYALFSLGTFYIDSESVYSLAFNWQNPLSIFTHMFVHVGIMHLLGNLVPLLLFALVLESAVLYFDVLFIFFFSGMLSAVIFSFFNSSTFLIGGSAGIAGIMSSALFVRPRHALALLVIIPVLLYVLAFPLAEQAVDFQEHELVEQKQALEAEVSLLNESLAVAVQENRTGEAQQLKRSLQQKNVSLSTTRERLNTSVEGRAREEFTPTDIPVHFYGAILGVLYLYLFRRKKLGEGREEFLKLGGQIFSLLESQRDGRRRK